MQYHVLLQPQLHDTCNKNNIMNCIVSCFSLNIIIHVQLKHRIRHAAASVQYNDNFILCFKSIQWLICILACFNLSIMLQLISRYDAALSRRPVRCIIVNIVLHINSMILYRVLLLSAISCYPSWSSYGILHCYIIISLSPYSFLWCFISCYNQCNDTISCHVLAWIIKISYDNYLWIWYKLTQCYKYLFYAPKKIPS